MQPNQRVLLFLLTVHFACASVARLVYHDSVLLVPQMAVDTNAQRRQAYRQLHVAAELASLDAVHRYNKTAALLSTVFDGSLAATLPNAGDLAGNVMNACLCLIGGKGLVVARQHE